MNFFRRFILFFCFLWIILLYLEMFGFTTLPDEKILDGNSYEYQKEEKEKKNQP